MERIEWNDGWLTGNKEIDRQHKNLINILNDVINEKENIMTSLNKLIDYTADHFFDEEQLMIFYKYPKLEEHVKMHKNFKMYLLDLSFDVITVKDETNVDRITSILREFGFVWFNKHFLEEDKAFINYIHSASF